MAVGYCLREAARRGEWQVSWGTLTVTRYFTRRVLTRLM